MARCAHREVRGDRAILPERHGSPADSTPGNPPERAVPRPKKAVNQDDGGVTSCRTGRHNYQLGGKNMNGQTHDFQ